MKQFLLKINCILCLLSFSITLNAQEIKSVEFYTNENDLFQEESEVHYLLANDVVLRSEADKKSQAVDKLKIGTSFQLLKKSKSTLTIKNIKSNWYQIKTASKTGWIWGGFIAQYAFGSQNNGSVKFVAGLDKIIKNEDDTWQAYYQIRAFRNGEQIAKISLKSPGWEFDNISNIGNQGLKNIDDILALSIPCSSESCGCTVGTSYIFWHNNTFYHVGDALGLVDADYSSDESFIFPSDMQGKPNVIIKEYSGIDDKMMKTTGNNNETIYRQVTQQEFEWNGTKLVAKTKKKQVKSYKVSY